MQIIRADLNHLDLLVPLFDAYRRFYRRESDIQGARAFLTERLQNGDSVIFLALDQEKPVGFTQLYPSFASLAMERLWILNDLFVTPDARRRGVGEALLKQAAEFAAGQGSRILTLATEITNTTAQRLYERMGWQRDNDFYHYHLWLEL